MYVGLRSPRGLRSRGIRELVPTKGVQGIHRALKELLSSFERGPIIERGGKPRADGAGYASSDEAHDEAEDRLADD